MHQRTRLVHVRQVEGDSELQRKKPQAALQDRARPVEGIDLGSPTLVVAALLHLGPAARQMVLVEHLAVRRLGPPRNGEI